MTWKRALVWSSGVILAWVALIVVLLVAAGVYLEYRMSSSDRAFNSVEWRAWGGNRSCDPDSPRLEMVEDVQTNRLKPGMRKASVVEILGPQDGHIYGPRSLEYGLGGLIDCEFLSLDFDRRGRLKLVYRYQG